MWIVITLILIYVFYPSEKMKRSMISVPMFEGWESMSFDERKLYFALLAASTGSSIWHEAIRLKTHSDKSFRILCNQLWSQAQDNPASMKNILGDDAYDLLERYQVNKNIVCMPEWAHRY
jgi:hypothetical protein